MTNRALSRWLVHSCTILSFTTARNENSELVETAATVSTGVPCRYMQGGASRPYPERTDQVNRNDLVIFPGSVTVSMYTRIANIANADGTAVIAGELEVVNHNLRASRKGWKLLSVEVKRQERDGW